MTDIFACGPDPAGYSYPAIGRTGQSIAPAMVITSSLRDIPQPYHGWGQAVDFSNGGDAGTPEMDAFARLLAVTYGPLSLELIHRCQNGEDIEWHNGVRSPGYFGEATMEAHRNHVHWAITNAGLAAYEGEAMTPEDRAYLDAKFKEVDDKLDQQFRIMQTAEDNNPLHLVSMTTLNRKLDALAQKAGVKWPWKK